MRRLFASGKPSEALAPIALWFAGDATARTVRAPLLIESTGSGQVTAVLGAMPP
jgi:hypothetical protein